MQKVYKLIVSASLLICIYFNWYVFETQFMRKQVSRLNSGEMSYIVYTLIWCSSIMLISIVAHELIKACSKYLLKLSTTYVIGLYIASYCISLYMMDKYYILYTPYIPLIVVLVIVCITVFSKLVYYDIRRSKNGLQRRVKESKREKRCKIIS